MKSWITNRPSENREGVRIGQLLERVIDKRIPSAALIASIADKKSNRTTDAGAIGRWMKVPLKYWKVTRKALGIRDTIAPATQWDYHSPLDGVVLFDRRATPYQPTRGSAAAERCWKASKAICRLMGTQFTKGTENGKMLSIWLAGCMRVVMYS